MSDQQPPQPERPILSTWRDTPSVPGAADEVAPEAVPGESLPEDTAADETLTDEAVAHDDLERPEPEWIAADTTEGSAHEAVSAEAEPQDVVPEHVATATEFEQAEPPMQEWVKGPSPFTVAAGLIFVTLAVLSVFKLVSDSTVDWAIALPATAIGVGLLIAAAGASTLFRRARQSQA